MGGRKKSGNDVSGGTRGDQETPGKKKKPGCEEGGGGSRSTGPPSKEGFVGRGGGEKNVSWDLHTKGSTPGVRPQSSGITEKPSKNQAVARRRERVREVSKDLKKPESQKRDDYREDEKIEEKKSKDEKKRKQRSLTRFDVT